MCRKHDRNVYSEKRGAVIHTWSKLANFPDKLHFRKQPGGEERQYRWTIHNTFKGMTRLFGTSIQLQDEFHLQPNSCFDGIFDWTRNVTLNYTAKVGASLMPSPCAPSREKWSGEQSRISLANSQKVVRTNEVARLVIII